MTRIGLIVVASAGLLGCSRTPPPLERLLPVDEPAELMRVDPTKNVEPGGPGTYGGYAVVGNVALTPRQRRQVVEALAAGIREGESENLAALCFKPRHALRSAGGGAIICFECRSLRWLDAGGERIGGNAVSLSAEPVFDQLLAVPASKISGDARGG